MTGWDIVGQIGAELPLIAPLTARGPPMTLTPVSTPCWIPDIDVYQAWECEHHPTRQAAE